MHNLGDTRSSRKPDHVLLTPDTFVRAPLPGMKDCTAIVHIGPAIGAGFTQYTAEFESGGALGDIDAQRFCFVLEGSITVEAIDRPVTLHPKGYAYCPRGGSHRVTAREKSKVVVIEKQYEPIDGLAAPSFLASHEDKIVSHPLDGDPALQVRCLLPEAMNFDFAVNAMVFQPGASLSMVEIHVMEHGLLMLEGGGIYRLGESWYPVTAGDVIWMAPWCPQWFGAIGKVPAKYLIYKNWNRHPLGMPR